MSSLLWVGVTITGGRVLVLFVGGCHQFLVDVCYHWWVDVTIVGVCVCVTIVGGWVSL